MDINLLRDEDRALEDGEWVGHLPGLGDAELRVRSAAAPVVVRAIGRTLRRAGEGADQDRLDRDVTAEHVLLDWRGFTDGGEPVPFDRTLARQWLEIGLFENAVRVASMRVGAKAAARLEALRGNLSEPSSEG